MRRDAMLDRDILKAAHDPEEDRRLSARAEVHMKLPDKKGLIEADPFHTMPAGGRHHSRPIERGPQVPHQYMVHLTCLWRLRLAAEAWASNPPD